MAIVENLNREFKFTEKDFNNLRKIANAHTGIIVTDDKYDMYYARLVKRLRFLKLNNFSEYVEYLKNNKASEFTIFIDSITTNLTSFFREKHHFDQLKNELIPKLAPRADASSGIRVWSAGCSTGEEPYSIAMTMMDSMHLMLNKMPTLVASDIDTTVLKTAATGIYDISRVEGLDKSIKKRWFARGKGDKSGLVKVSKKLTELIDFKQINLMQSWPHKDKFHIIFCRNVVIYFDRPTKQKLFSRFADQLVDDGYLILGHSESLQGLTDQFETIGKTVFRKVK